MSPLTKPKSIQSILPNHLQLSGDHVILSTLLRGNKSNLMKNYILSTNGT